MDNKHPTQIILFIVTLIVLVFLVLNLYTHMGKSTEINNSTIAVNTKTVITSAEEVCPVMVGMKIPAVTVRTVDGNEVSIYNVISKKPTVLIFYRGGWCPYCNLQLGQLQKIEKLLMDIGYQIVAISADRHEKLKESARKKNIKYTLLSDISMKAAQSFGIAFHVDDATVEKYKKFGLNIEDASGEKHHLLPVPAVFVLKTDGTIVFSYVNPDYKVRISPEVILAAAKAELKIKK